MITDSDHSWEQIKQDTEQSKEKAALPHLEPDLHSNYRKPRMGFGSVSQVRKLTGKSKHFCWEGMWNVQEIQKKLE